jgi:hypothetical protein
MVRQEAAPKLAQELEEAKDQRELIRPLREDVSITLQRTRLRTEALLLTELLRRLQAGTWRLIWLHPTQGALPFPEDLLAELTLDSFNTARSEVIFGGWRYHVRVEITEQTKPKLGPEVTRVRDAMLANLRSGKCSPDDLRSDSKNLIPYYRTSRSTYERARAAALAVFNKS